MNRSEKISYDLAVEPPRAEPEEKELGLAETVACTFSGETEGPMTAKHQLAMTAFVLILTAGVAHAGPCNTTGTGDGQQTVNRAAQADQRQEHVQPSVAQQPQSTGKAEQPNASGQSAVPSAKMTDQDQSPSTPSQGSETSTKMTDQGC